MGKSRNDRNRSWEDDDYGSWNEVLERKENAKKKQRSKDRFYDDPRQDD